MVKKIILKNSPQNLKILDLSRMYNKHIKDIILNDKPVYIFSKGHQSSDPKTINYWAWYPEPVDKLKEDKLKEEKLIKRYKKLRRKLCGKS